MANEVIFTKTYANSPKDTVVTDLPLGTETVASVVGANDIGIVLGSGIKQGKGDSKSGYIDAVIEELANRMRELGYT